MSKEEAVEYNNNPFTFKGRLGRLSYIFQNSILMILAFKFIYSPYLYGFITDMEKNPLYRASFDLLKSMPQYHEMMIDLKAMANPSFTAIIIRYLFLVPLRIIDIKRIRDIVNRNLNGMEITIVAIFFSLPFVDFITTLFLVLIPANKFAKNKTINEIKKVDMKSAQDENFLQLNQRLFEAGKISRAEFEKARDNYKISKK